RTWSSRCGWPTAATSSSRAAPSSPAPRRSCCSPPRSSASSSATSRSDPAGRAPLDAQPGNVVCCAYRFGVAPAFTFVLGGRFAGGGPESGESTMSVLFTNVRVFDASGGPPFAGEVLVQGNRISRIARGARALPVSGVTVVDGGGATLMPGLVEAHTHFSWNDQPTLSAIQRMPTEEHILWCAHIAERYLDMGWTSGMGAAPAEPRLDVVIRNAIESGQIPGPRYLAAS